MPDAPLVSAIVVSYNVRALLVDTLRSLYANTEVPVEAIVVDNDSEDGSADAVAEQFPQAKLIRSPENLGFGKANNLGFQHVSGRFVLLLNPDVVLDPGCVDRLADFLFVHPEAGAVGPRLRRPDGKLLKGAGYRPPEVARVVREQLEVAAAS